MIRNALISNQAKKAIKNLDDAQRRRIGLEIEKLINGQIAGTLGRGDLKDIWILRIKFRGEALRVAYRLQDKTYHVLLAGTRENFYKRLKRGIL